MMRSYFVLLEKLQNLLIFGLTSLAFWNTTLPQVKFEKFLSYSSVHKIDLA